MKLGFVRKKFAFFSTYIVLAGFGFIISACTVRMRNSPLALFKATNPAQPFTYAWPFDFNTISSYAYDPSKIDFTGGVCKLTSTNQIDNSSACSGFGDGITAACGGSFNGVAWDGGNGYLRLGSGGSCDGTTSACANQIANSLYELGPAWTPQWSSILAYWKLDGTAGPVANASSILATVGVNGVAANTTGTALNYLPAKIGNGISFNGNGDRVSVASGINPVSYNTGFSMSAWVYFINDNVTALGFDDSGAFGVTYIRRLGGNLQYSFGTGSSAQDYTTTVNLPLSTWLHIVVVHANTVDKAYLNGVLVHTGTGATLANTSSTFRIGGDGYGSATARMDDVAIWGAALSDTTVSTIYAHQAVKYSGTFTSRVMDAFQTGMSWTKFSWIPTLPFLKALPDAACSPGPNCTHTNSESSTDYTSLVGSTGTVGDNNLMSGIVGLWHLDEPAGTSAPSSINDNSGNGNHGSPVTIAFSGNGMFQGAAEFPDSANSRINIPILNLNYITVSAWVKERVPTAFGAVITLGDFGPFNNVKINGNLWGAELTGALLGTTGLDSSGLHPINDGLWHLLTYTYNGTLVKLYTDGILDSSAVYLGGNLSFNQTVSRWNIGNRFGVWGAIPAVLDEVAIWSRALDPKEVQQLYRRGANRIKHQVRVCTAADCSDDAAGANWKGPDGTNQTYFSELNNNTIPLAMTGPVQKTVPSMLFSNFTNPVATSRYFQYRTILESDDTGTACNYGSGPTWCSPELKSVTVDPVHYDASSPSVIGKIGVPFSSLSRFVETLGASCASGVGYNLGIGSSYASATWYYWSGLAWRVANGTDLQSNTAAIITSNITSFGTQAGIGTVYFKAYLKSSGTSKCELDQLDLSGLN